MGISSLMRHLDTSVVFWKDELPKEEERYTTAVSQMHPHSL